MNFTSSEN